MLLSFSQQEEYLKKVKPI